MLDVRIVEAGYFAQLCKRVHESNSLFCVPFSDCLTTKVILDAIFWSHIDLMPLEVFAGSYMDVSIECMVQYLHIVIFGWGVWHLCKVPKDI